MTILLILRPNTNNIWLICAYEMYMLIMPVGHLSEFYQRNCHLLSHVWRCLTMSATFMNISSHDWNNYGHVFKMFEPCCDTDRCLHVFNMLWHGSNLKYKLICSYVLRTYWMCMEHFLSHLNMSGLTRLCLYINGSCLDTSHIWIQYVCARVVHVWGYFEMTWSSKGFVWISLDVLGTFVKHVSDKSGLCLDIT